MSPEYGCCWFHVPRNNMVNAFKTGADGLPLTDRISYTNGLLPANYNIEPYQKGVNINWTQENAREALRWERRLEFATEGWRFFDLVRWGIAAELLNDYLEVERSRRLHLNVAQFQKNKNECVPIPEQEIVLSEGLYQ